HAFLTLSVGAAPYTFVEGYTVLDETNSPGIGTNLAATAGIKYGNFGADLTSGIVYFAREISTDDGRTNTTPGLLAVITLTNFNGANYTDTGLLDVAPNSQAINAS